MRSKNIPARHTRSLLLGAILLLGASASSDVALGQGAAAMMPPQNRCNAGPAAGPYCCVGFTTTQTGSTPAGTWNFLARTPLTGGLAERSGVDVPELRPAADLAGNSVSDIDLRAGGWCLFGSHGNRLGHRILEFHHPESPEVQYGRCVHGRLQVERSRPPVCTWTIHIGSVAQ